MKFLNYKLYHGTSDIFLDSIKKYGLGLRDPELFDKNLLINLATEISSHKKTSQYWQGHEYFINKMIAEEGRYKYQGIYFSASQYTAKRYGSKNFGSEYIATIHDLYQNLKLINSSRADQIIKDNYKLKKLFKIENKPILITWNRAPIDDYLGTETGFGVEHVKQQICSMDELVKDFPHESDILLQQHNFICKKIIPYKQIKFEYFSPIAQ